jgi:PGF-pre-PGF domain-containing protein
VEDAREEVEAIEPATETSVSIEEAGTESEDGSGITVDVSEQTETEAVDQITFEDTEVSGTVDVEEYTDPPEDVTETVAESVAQDVAGDEATSDESTADSESANVNVVTIADISISSDDADTSDTSESDSGSADTTADSGTTATVTMSVSADELDNPANAVIVHEREDGWEELETSVVDTTSGEVTLEAQTESFSLFAVTEVQEPAQTETTEQTEETTENKDEDGSPVVPIIVGLLAVAAVGGAVYYLRGDES